MSFDRKELKIILHEIPFFLGDVYSVRWVITPYQACAQEEESAEISLELYSDEFQEYFFEALKQKGIENYDKAINLLIKCKKLQPLETAVDYELGINYFALKKFDEAAVYLFKAVEYNPDNYWYLDQLFKTYETIEGTSKAMEMVENLAKKVISIRSNY